MATLLGQHGDTSVAQALRQSLQDEMYSVRKSAVSALDKLGVKPDTLTQPTTPLTQKVEKRIVEEPKKESVRSRISSVARNSVPPLPQ